eukprot:6016970-Amphidinium_carterae.1
MMNNPAAFIEEVKAFNANEIPEGTLVSHAHSGLHHMCVATPYKPCTPETILRGRSRAGDRNVRH